MCSAPRVAASTEDRSMRSTSSNRASLRWGCTRGSMTVTSCPASIRTSTRCEPMNPLPPVTTTLAMALLLFKRRAQRPQDALGFTVLHAREDGKADVSGAQIVGHREGGGGIAAEDRMGVERHLVDLP